MHRLVRYRAPCRERTPRGERRAGPGLGRLAAGLAIALSLAGCGLPGQASPTPFALPAPTCGGARVVILGALPCDRLVAIALEVLRGEVPRQLDRGVISVSVDLQGCPKDELPAQLDCSGQDFVQLVTFTFGPSVSGGPIEPSLSVGLEPVSGRVLGIVNPLLR